MKLAPETIEELRPVAHQHMSMLTAAGIKPAHALAIATHVCALVYSDAFTEALAMAFGSLESPRPAMRENMNSQNNR